jgi:excisionase family DNA binding protein
MKLLRTEEVAKILSFTPKKVRQMLAAGEIPSVKIGGEYRVIDIELNNFIENQRVAA